MHVHSMGEKVRGKPAEVASLPPMWIPRIELRLSGLVEIIFICGAILLVSTFFLHESTITKLNRRISAEMVYH